MAYAPVETLESLSEDTLTTCVRTRLLGHPSAPPVVWSQGEVPEQFLVDAYALSTDEAFKVRLKQAVKRLLSSWRPGLNDDIAYGGRLIYLTGRLGVEDGDVILSRLATEPAVERLVLYDAPVKNLVLRTLLEFPGQEARQDFWEPLMHDARYFDTAFLALSLRGPEEGLRYLPQYVQMALRTGLREAIVELWLANFIARHLWPDRLAELGSVLTRLTPDERQRVLVILQRAIPPEAFKVVDSILYQAVQSISDLILASDLAPLDLAKVRTILGSQGKAILGTGLAQGESRAVIAAQRAIESLLMEVSVHDAQYVLINITGGSKMSLHEVHEASSVIQSAAHPDAEIIFGAVSDEHMGDKIRVTVIATSFVDVTPNASTQMLPL